MKYLLSILLALTLSGCATIGSNYNTPFVNTDETLKLRIGMTKDEVLKNIGTPIAVYAGFENKICWLYEVRIAQVASEKSFMGDETVTEPKKSGKTFRHGPALHKLLLTFTDDKLSRWEPESEGRSPFDKAVEK